MNVKINIMSNHVTTYEIVVTRRYSMSTQLCRNFTVLNRTIYSGVTGISPQLLIERMVCKNRYCYQKVALVNAILQEFYCPRSDHLFRSYGYFPTNLERMVCKIFCCYQKVALKTIQQEFDRPRSDHLFRSYGLFFHNS